MEELELIVITKSEDEHADQQINSTISKSLDDQDLA